MGDKVAVRKRPDGKLWLIFRIADWPEAPPWTKDPATGLIGTVKDINVDGVMLSSYGQMVTVPADHDSLMLDHQRFNAIGFQFHEKWYEVDIDPDAEFQNAMAVVPCWRDRLGTITTFFGLKVSKEVGGR